MGPRRATKALRAARLTKQQALQKKDDESVARKLANEQEKVGNDTSAIREKHAQNEMEKVQVLGYHTCTSDVHGQVDGTEHDACVCAELADKLENGDVSGNSTIDSSIKEKDRGDQHATDEPTQLRPSESTVTARPSIGTTIQSTSKPTTSSKLSQNNVSIINNVSFVSDECNEKFDVLFQRIEKLEKSLNQARTNFATQLETQRVESEKKFAAMQSWNDVLAQQIQAFSNSRRFHGHKKQMKGWQ